MNRVAELAAQRAVINTNPVYTTDTLYSPAVAARIRNPHQPHVKVSGLKVDLAYNVASEPKGVGLPSTRPR